MMVGDQNGLVRTPRVISRWGVILKKALDLVKACTGGEPPKQLGGVVLIKGWRSYPHITNVPTN